MKVRERDFEHLLERVVAQLAKMPAAERARWRDLLSYISAMIYHERSEKEQSRLFEALERSVGSDELRQEISEMGKTMADVLMDRGRAEAALETRRQTLVRLLHRRFGDLPADVVDTVMTTSDTDRLDAWLDRLVTATTLDEMEIPRV